MFYLPWRSHPRRGQGPKRHWGPSRVWDQHCTRRCRKRRQGCTLEFNVQPSSTIILIYGVKAIKNLIYLYYFVSGLGL